MKRFAYRLILLSAQIVLAYLGSLIAVLVVSMRVNPLDSNGWTIVEYVVSGSAASALAFLVSRLFPAAADPGRLVCLLPVVGWVAMSGWDVWLFGWHDTLSYFAGRGESGWVRVLFTQPVWGCCCYSAFMAAHLFDGRRAS